MTVGSFSCLLKVKHSRHVLKEAGVTHTPYFDCPDEQEENKL